jgi:hypothetical protein
VFKSKKGDSFTFVDWQMSAKGPIAMELMAMCGYSMSNEADYDRLPELIEHFYNIVKASAPDMCAECELAVDVLPTLPSAPSRLQCSSGYQCTPL